MDSIVQDAIDEAEAEPPASGDGDDAVPQETETGTMTDEELQSVLQDLQTEITVVGCGGPGATPSTECSRKASVAHRSWPRIRTCNISWTSKQTRKY